MVSKDEAAGFEAFADGLSTTVIAKLSPDAGKKQKKVKGRKNEIKPVAKVAQPEGEELGDAAELSDFVQVCLLCGK